MQLPPDFSSFQSLIYLLLSKYFFTAEYIFPSPIPYITLQYFLSTKKRDISISNSSKASTIEEVLCKSIVCISSSLDAEKKSKSEIILNVYGFGLAVSYCQTCAFSFTQNPLLQRAGRFARVFRLW